MSESKIEILRAVIQGEELNPIPHAVWRHFPKDDLSAETLAKRQLEYLEKFNPVVMKVSPSGRYCVIDWGCEIAYDENSLSGSAHCTSFRIKSIEDWYSLEELNANEGMFGEQLRALELIAKGMKGETPFVETVFNPLMVASKMIEDKELLLRSIRENPKAFHEALRTITKVMKDFAKGAIENGASGIFLATQEATFDFLKEEEFIVFGMRYDHEILDAIKNKSEFNITHIHGNNIMFDLIAKNYPVQALNWHDQTTSPSLVQATKIFAGALMGGIAEHSLVNATQEEITKSIRATVDSVAGKRLIVSPGCVIPVNVPDERILTIINALKK